MAQLVLQCRLEMWARERPDCPAILGSNGALTFGQLQERSEGVRDALTSIGIRSEMCLGLRFSMATVTDYAIAYVAAVKLGCPIVSIPSDLPPSDVRHIVDHTAITLLIEEADAAGCETSSPTVSIGQLNPALRGVCEHPSQSADIPADAIAEIVMTSGTEGVPRAVAVTRSDLDAELADSEPSAPDARRRIHALPIGSNFSLVALRTGLAEGAATIVPGTFHPDQFLAIAERYQATDVFLVPSMASMFFLSREAQRFELSTVEFVVLSGAVAAPSLMSRLAALFPSAQLFNFYTSTEAWPAATVMEFGIDRPGSVGRPVSCDSVAILGPDGRELEPNEEGDVVLRTEGRPRRRLWRQTDESGSCFLADGIRMGDRGFLDSDGFLFLLGRVDDVVNVGGHNVSCLAVEQVLLEHPEVVEVAVVGEADDVLGERLVAYLVTSADIDVGALGEFAAMKLPRTDVPTLFQVVSSLPHNRNGKLLKRELGRGAGPGGTAPASPVAADGAASV